MATYTPADSSELQAAFDAVNAGDVILLDHTQTYVGEFLVRDRGVIPDGQEIVVESDSPLGNLPAAGYRTSPAYTAYLAKLQVTQTSPHQNDQALTIETGANGYIFRNFQVDPNLYGSQFQITVGFNDERQTEYDQIPYNVTFDRLFMRGHPVSGHKGAINVHGNNVKIHNCYFKDYKGFGQDAVPVGGGNCEGPLEMINNYCEGAGYGSMILGGVDNYIRTIATVSAATTSSATLSTVKDLSVGQVVSFLCGSNALRRHPRVLTIDTGTKQITFDTIDTVPDNPGDCRWGVNPTGITFRRNYVHKPLAWRDAIVAAPAISMSTATNPSGVPAGTWYVRVQAYNDQTAYQNNTYMGDLSNEMPSTHVAATNLTPFWLAVQDAYGYRVYVYQKDGGGAIINGRRFDTASLTYTITGSGGTSFTAFNAVSKWSVKNLFELKMGNNAQIDSNIFEYTWYNGAGTTAIWLKVNNQEGGHDYAQTDHLVFEYNCIRHTPGFVDTSCQRATGETANDLPKKPIDWKFRHNLIFDSNTSYIDPEFSLNLYGSRGSGACDDMEWDHNTLIHTDGGGSTYLDYDIAKYGYWTNVKYLNNLLIKAEFGGISGPGGEGKNNLSPASNDTYDLNRNVVADGNAAAYTVSGKTNYTPDLATFQAQFKNYGSDTIADWRLKRMSEGDASDSIYLNAGTDGLDIGCDVATLMSRLEGVVEGLPEAADEEETNDSCVWIGKSA